MQSRKLFRCMGAAVVRLAAGVHIEHHGAGVDAVGRAGCRRTPSKPGKWTRRRQHRRCRWRHEHAVLRPRLAPQHVACVRRRVAVRAAARLGTAACAAVRPSGCTIVGRSSTGGTSIDCSKSRHRLHVVVNAVAAAHLDAACSRAAAAICLVGAHHHVPQQRGLAQVKRVAQVGAGACRHKLCRQAARPTAAAPRRAQQVGGAGHADGAGRARQQ
mmetsp:Transcript_30536/g.90531  ORF Transcript_30536/g.90531 Transcript_30536/m.90531 type:complete len:215 (-) Transcript_30536:106-750(-)